MARWRVDGAGRLQRKAGSDTKSPPLASDLVRVHSAAGRGSCNVTLSTWSKDSKWDLRARSLQFRKERQFQERHDRPNSTTSKPMVCAGKNDLILQSITINDFFYAILDPLRAVFEGRP